MFEKIVKNGVNGEMSLNKIDLRLKLCSYFIVNIDLILFVSSNRSIFKKKNSSNSNLKWESYGIFKFKIGEGKTVLENVKT